MRSALSAAILAVVALHPCDATAQRRPAPEVAALGRTLQPPVTSPGRLQIEDQRPRNTRQTRAVTSNGFDCHNGVWQLGDDRVVGDRLARLETRIIEAFGSRFDGQPLVVRRYAIFFNRRAWQEGVMYASQFGAVGAAIADGIHPGPGEGVRLQAKCEQERMPMGGWFDTSELSNNFSPFIVEMDLSLGGQDYVLRSVYSPPAELGPDSFRAWDRDYIQATAQEALALANNKLVEEIAARFSASRTPDAP